MALATPPRVSVLINEQSGAAPRQDQSVHIQELFVAAGVQVRLERVRHGGDVAARARQAATRGDTLVAAGGDGTVGTVAAVAVERQALFGTLNHFARDLGIPRDLERAVHTILSGRVQQVDVGEVNGRIFVNNSSIGIYPRMVWEREKERRRGRRKKTAFVIAMLRAWRTYRTLAVRLTIDGTSHDVRTPFIFVGNNEYVAEGFNLGSRRALDTGRLSVFVAPDLGRFEILTLPLKAIAGRLETDAHFANFTAATVSVELRRPRASVAIDGELTIMRAPLDFRVRRGALRLLVPAAPDT
jgi:diacylglycerol kinase family enzyme